MRLIVHIFKKDVRRLWGGIAVVLALEAAVTYRDCGTDTEGSLAVLLLIAWFGLLAMAVQEDPMVGDRQFWITRPPRWKVLLGSKALFALVVIHLPSFAAGAIILAAHGFQPLAWIPQLLVRQLLFAALVTLPAIALAAVLENFAYLVLAVIGIVGLLGAITSSGNWFQAHSIRRGEAGMGILLGTLALSSAAIVLLQFAQRYTWRSRGVGVGAIGVIALMAAFLSQGFLARVYAAVHPAAAELAFHAAPRPAFHLPGGYRSTDWVDVRVPVSVSGVPAGDETGYDVTSLDLNRSGQRVAGLSRGILVDYLGPDWLIFRVQRRAYEDLKKSAVDLKVVAAVVLHRTGAVTSVPVGAKRPVEGLGRCSSKTFWTESYSGQGFSTVTVFCESPAAFPLPPAAWVAEGGGKRFLNLGTDSQGLLSPIERAQGSVRADDSSVEIAPDYLLGSKVVSFTFHGLALKDYANIPGE